MTGRQERSDENIALTYEQIKRFSGRDAEAYLVLLDQYERYWKPAFARHRFTTPPPWGEPDALEELVTIEGSGMEPVHQFMSLQALAYDFFESPELRTLFMRAASTSTGCFGDDPPGLQGLAHNLPLVLSFEPAAIPIGGTQAITDALVSAGTKRGVEYHTRAEVDRVVVSGSRATGIKLADGTEVATDLVVSSLGIPQTVLRMLADAEVSPRLVERINNIHYDRGQLWWVNVAVHEPPSYAAAATNPGIGPQPRLYWGPKDPDYYATRYKAEIYLEGMARQTFALTSCDTLWDPARAPEGQHVIGVEEFAAPIRLFDKQQWRELERKFADQLVEQWSPLRTEHDAGKRDRGAGVRSAGHLQRPSRHDRGWLLGRLHHRLAARALPADAGAVGLPSAARQRVRLLVEHALRLGHRPRLVVQLLADDRPRPRHRSRLNDALDLTG